MRIQKRYAEKEDAKHVSVLRQAFNKAGSLANIEAMGAMLYMAGRLKASVYTFAEVALRAQPGPGTPGILTAAVGGMSQLSGAYSNLGASLNDMGDYANAAEVLRYAVKLEPDNALAQSNLATTYAYLGDRKTAIGMLNHSLNAMSGQLEANLTLAQLYQCENKPQQALMAVQRAQKIKPTQRGRTIMKQVANAAGKDDGWMDDEGAGDSATTGPVPNVPHPTLPISLYGPDVSEWDTAVSQHVRKMITEEAVLSRKADSVGIGGIPDRGPTDYQLALRAFAGALQAENAAGQPIVIYVSNRALWEQFKHLETLYNDKIGKTAGKYEDRIRSLNDVTSGALQDISARANTAASRAENINEAQDAYCAIAFPGAKSVYEQLAHIYGVEVAAESALIRDYYRRSNALLAQLSNPYDARAMDLWRRSQVLDWESDLWGTATTIPEGPEVTANTEFPCVAKGGAATESPDPEVEDPPKGKGGKCHMSFGLNISIFSLAATCDKIEISGGEGLMGTLDWNIKSRVGTVYIGAGAALGAQVNLGAASIGPKLGAETGVSLSFDGNGDIVDGGLYSKGTAQLYTNAITVGDSNGSPLGNIGGSKTFTFNVVSGFSSH